MYFNTGLVRNLGHFIVFLELWAHLFQENLGTRRLATRLEGTVIVPTSSHVGCGIVAVDKVGLILYGHCLYYASPFCSITCILFHQPIFLHLILRLLLLNCKNYLSNIMLILLFFRQTSFLGQRFLIVFVSFTLVK